MIERSQDARPVAAERPRDAATGARAGRAETADRARQAGRAGQAGSADWELFLLRLRYREGRLLAVAGNTPILLDDPETVWVVFSGRVDVFVVRVEDGRAVGARSHLFHATDGAALFGMDLRGRSVGILVSGAPGTQLLRVKRSGLARLAETGGFAPLVAGLIEGWVDALSAGLARDLPPRDLHWLEAGREVGLPDRQVVRTRKAVVWVTHRQGRSLFMGRPELPPVNGGGAMPLSPRTWLEVAGPARLYAVQTDAALRSKAAWSDLDRFHDLALASLAGDAEQRARAERQRLADRASAERARLDGAYARLASVLTPGRSGAWAGADGRDPLVAAARLVGDRLGIAIGPAPVSPAGGSHDDPLRAIARASRVHTRRVALRGSWWTSEAGPLLAYREQDRRPVALLPTAARRYELYDPVAGTRTPVTARVAATLGPFADTFYRRFDDRALTARDLLGFGLRGCRHDVSTIVVMGVLAGLLALLTPIVTGVLFDRAIPAGQRDLLVQMVGALLVGAVATLLFQVAREIAVLRLAGRMDAAIQAAVMVRLLELPASFFREFTAGDLAVRALAIGTIRETVSRVALATIMSGLTSAFSFVLLFYYDSKLALLATGLALVLLLAIALTTWLQLRCQRVLTPIGARLSGLVLELVNGVSKFRVAGAEARAFAHWAGDFAGQRQASYRARTVTNGLLVFNAAYPVLTSMAVFAALTFWLDPQPSVGSFLGFNAAFGQFVTAVLGIGTALATVVQIVPTYEQARPILEALPEVDETRADPGELSGAIELNNVSFRYAENGPPVLDDISLQIRPGEFVALVGPSGSGKSTLLRLLLGFEAPAAGAILYDGRDLAGLDPRAVRRQIGSVLQNGRLMSGNLFENIVGSSTLTIDDAWEAARLAGLEEDIRQLPMEMQTVIGEGGGTLSGGQRQRLLIARAIVNRPRIVFFDEATSALDNRTQEIVSKSLEGLAATRVVIAHRLSTIVNADRIYVLQGGRLVESGTYRELIQRRGLFAALARRQIA
jgi:NHLM bacteriocin system ABC transporter ATP-binding protein